MKMFSSRSLRLIVAIIAMTACAATSPSPTQSADSPAFTYDSTSFLFHGKPYVIVGGQMDPQRIPPEYWRDRLSKARAMGLNTIFSYVYWNLLEPKQGEWTSNEEPNNIAQYFKIAQEEGLNIILRPGPYICGERDWGGFPAWLSQVPGMEVRTYNAAFLNASKNYLERLAGDLRDLQVTRGGPLLMVQVENEYGSYGSNHQYTAALRDVLRQNFDIPLYTNDGGVSWTLAGGAVPGVLAEIDGDPVSGFAARQKYITDKSELGPLLDGEYYTLAPDFWGPQNAHNTPTASQVAQFVKDLDFVLGANNSISLYMFHGGTNFALSNGALWKNFIAPFTTSYDYGAPLDESGRTTSLYFTLRKTIQKYFPAGSIPTPPANVPLLAIPDIPLEPLVSLFNVTAPKIFSPSPVTMEALGQSYGFVRYDHSVNETLTGVLRPGDRARDRVLVFVNGVRKGVMDGTYASPAMVSLALKPGDLLQLLVENLGRVDYWSLESGTSNGLTDPYKGIKGDVTIGGTIVKGWDIVSLPLDNPALDGEPHAGGVTPGMSPIFYKGAFTVNGTTNTDRAALDTFVSVPNGVKGMIWVNGVSLGRYWVVGPQQSLYLPGTILKPGASNEIVVLELEPKSQTMIAQGMAQRQWANYPDPDAP